MEKFISRENELEYLNKEYNKKESSLIILYGRRRIGKTSLILQVKANEQLMQPPHFLQVFSFYLHLVTNHL